MRTKTTLGLMLICGAVLAACGQKEPAAPAASTAAAPAPVQTSTPPPQRRWPQQRNRRMRWVSARSPTSARCATPQGLPGHQSRATRPTGGHASHKVRTPFTSTHWRASTATRGPCPHAVDRPCRTTPSRLRLTTWWRSRSSAMHPLPPSNLGRRRCLAGVPLLAVGMFVRPALADPTVERASTQLLGTQIDIIAQDARPGAAGAAMRAAFVEMARLECLMSRYRPDSQVSALARAAGRNPVPVAPEVMSVFKLARQVSEQSRGAF